MTACCVHGAMCYFQVRGNKPVHNNTLDVACYLGTMCVTWLGFSTQYYIGTALVLGNTLDVSSYT